MITPKSKDLYSLLLLDLSSKYIFNARIVSFANNI